MAERIQKKSIAWEASKFLLRVGADIAFIVVFGLVGGVIGFFGGLAIETVTSPITSGLLAIAVAAPYGVYRGIRLYFYIKKAYAESKDVLPGI